MPLPHFNNLMVNTPIPQEVVYKNLFEITFVLPNLLQSKFEPLMLLQNATTVDLNLTEAISVAEQKFKYSTRAFMKTPEKTHVEFSIKFNVNANSLGSMETWNTLKAWYDLVWNSQDGSLHYKSDIIGTIIVNQHDKKGFVLRRVTFNNVQIKNVDGVSLAWGGGDIMETGAGFVADYWKDEYIGGPNVLDGLMVSGY
jgi:hypothetical protein